MEYGWPLQDRLNHFKQLVESGTKQYDARLEFMDVKQILPVFRIPLELPKYRIGNGRTTSLQLQWLAEHPEIDKDFFKRDSERDEVQKVQHELLKELISDKLLYPYFSNSSVTQDEFIILDSLGFVVNGNRRLCTWRILVEENPTEYPHYKHIDVVILPPANNKAIDKLEGALQIKQDIKADYTWDALANMIVTRMENDGLDEQTLADYYGLDVREIREYVEKKSYADEYLRSRGKEGRWKDVSDKEYAFDEMIKRRKQLQNNSEKRLFEVESYALMDDPSGGRAYQLVKDVFKYRNEIKKALSNSFPVSNSIELTSEDPLFDADLVKEMKLAEIIDHEDNRKQALEIIKNSIEEQQQADKDKNSEQYVFKQLKLAQSALINAVNGTKESYASKDGVPEILTEMKPKLKEIEDWL